MKTVIRCSIKTCEDLKQQKHQRAYLTLSLSPHSTEHGLHRIQETSFSHSIARDTMPLDFFQCCVSEVY